MPLCSLMMLQIYAFPLWFVLTHTEGILLMSEDIGEEMSMGCAIYMISHAWDIWVARWIKLVVGIKVFAPSQSKSDKI